LTTDSIGAQCPTASSLPLLSGHGQNDTVLSGQPCPDPALVGAAGAAPAFVGAAGPGSRFCRGWRWRCTLLSGRPSARYTLLSGLLLSLPIVPGQAAPRSRFYRGVGAGAGRNLFIGEGCLQVGSCSAAQVGSAPPVTMVRPCSLPSSSPLCPRLTCPVRITAIAAVGR
jgi:hypothetical protein